MFLEFTIKNFRTHIETRIPVYDMNIIIGSNNSGKSNFLSAIQHFTSLVRRANPDERNSQSSRQLKETDLFPHKHRLHHDKPMEFNCKWKKNGENIFYSIEIFDKDSKILCNEKLIIQFLESNNSKEFTNLKNEFMNLRLNINQQLKESEKERQIANE
ncbi:MAG: AAA family ATPase, partial [Leptospiraceae bacterium]|nr:AAA family ATPase [Leptospiraceae bacterium]